MKYNYSPHELSIILLSTLMEEAPILSLIARAHQLVPLLNSYRASNYNLWYQIGSCLHNIDSSLLPLWIEFSKTSVDKINKCNDLWLQMGKTHYTIQTLEYFASIDSPAEYAKLNNDNIKKLVRNGLDCSTYSIAKLLIEKYKLRFKCSDVKKNIWYEYRLHRWTNCDIEYVLHNLMTSSIIQEYEQLAAILSNSIGSVKSYEKRELINDLNNISKLTSKLKSHVYINNVIQQFKYLAYDQEFSTRLDTNTNLIGFTNGVYDLDTFMFRDGCPEDSISMYTKYDYIEYDANDPIMLEIEEYMRKIQPDDEIREYMYSILSTCLHGSTRANHSYVFVNKNSNGLRIIAKLLKLTFGMLICTDTKKHHNKNLRISILEETHNNLSMFKKKYIDEDIQTKPFLFCNNLSDYDDLGLNFCDNTEVLYFPNTEEPNHIDIVNRIKIWKDRFMFLLIQKFKKYQIYGVVVPQKIKDDTDQYKKQLDIIYMFTQQCLKETTKPEYITINNLYDQFNTWFQYNWNDKLPKHFGLCAIRDYFKTKFPNNYSDGIDGLMGYMINDM